MPETVSLKEYIYSSLFILLIVFIFNYNVTFGLNVLLLDDNARFLRAMDGDLLNNSFLRMSWILALVKAMNYKLLLMGADAIRAFYLFVFVLPLSLVFYYFNRVKLDMDNIPAVFAAIIINILPAQYHIPKFIDGSYTVIGLLFTILSLCFGLTYLKDKKIYGLVLFTVLWHIANQLFAELGIIVSPVIFLFIVSYCSPIRSKIILTIPLVLVVCYRLYQALSIDRGAAGTATIHSLGEMSHRFLKATEWGAVYNMSILPMVYLSLVLFIAGILLGYFLMFRKRRKYWNLLKLSTLYLLFGIFAMSVFLIASRYFSTRYFFTAFVGLWTSYAICLYVILKEFIKNKVIVAVLMFSILLLAGYTRYVNTENDNGAYNRRHALIMEEIQKLGDIKPNSLFVITGIANGTGEYYVWSSGYIQYATQRGDIAGVIGNEYMFYNPFNVKEMGYNYKMSGLDIMRPMYFINVSAENKQFFLKWDDATSNDSTWTIYKRGEDAMLKELITGKGMDDYLEKVQNSNLSVTDILWGDPKGLHKVKNKK